MAVIASVVLAFALISISRIKDCAITLRRVGKGGGLKSRGGPYVKFMIVPGQGG